MLYLSFLVPPLGAASIVSATLRLHPIVQASSHGVHLRGAVSTSWTETGMTYLTAPAVGPVVSVAGGYASGSTVAISATRLVTRAGRVTLALTVPLDGGYQGFSSRESAFPPCAPAHHTSTPIPTPRPIPTPLPVPPGERGRRVASPRSAT